MATIDYSGRDVSITVGALNITKNLVNCALRFPPYQPKGKATLEGQLELDLGGEADIDAYDMFLRPDLWRPGQAQVRVTVSGELLPILRIDRYAFNRLQRTATATLVQVIDLVRGEEAELPELPMEDINKTPHANSLAAGAEDYFAGTYKTPLADVCARLVAKEFEDTPLEGLVVTDFSLFTALQTADRPVQYVDGIKQVDEFVGAVFGALTVDTNEKVVAVSLDPFTQPGPLFSRPGSQVELEEDLSNIDFWSPIAYLEGERFTEQGLDRVSIGIIRDGDELDNLTPDGRFYFQLTEEDAAHDTIFEQEDGQDGDDIFAAEKKTIYYQYVDRDFKRFGTPLEAQTAFLTPAVQALLEPFPDKQDDEAVFQTVTVKLWPRRRIDPTNDSFSKTAFSAAEVIIEGPSLKAVFKPKLTLDKDSPTDFTLTLATKEVLTTKAPAVIEPEVIKDENGDKYIAQSRVPLIPRLPRPEYNLVSTQIVSTFELPAETPTWAPFSQKPLYVQFGFVTSQEDADYVCQLIAERELARRDSVQATMPIPLEWLEAGCPIAPLANLYDAQYMLDGITLSLSPDEAIMTCSALLIGKLSSPVPETTPPVYIPAGIA